MCFWDDGGLIVCTHGYIKDKQKAPKAESKRAERMKRDYFEAKNRDIYKSKAADQLRGLHGRHETARRHGAVHEQLSSVFKLRRQHAVRPVAGTFYFKAF
jgi:hypothetical protein